MSKRTTHRSSKSSKLYAVRDKKGQFKDIQTYKRAHGTDAKPAPSGKDKSSKDEIRESAERFSQAMKRLAKR